MHTRTSGQRPVVSTEVLRRLYFDERLSLAQAAARVGMSRQGIAGRLRTAGFTLRDTNRAKAPTVELARLYFEQGLTLTQVAERLGMTEPSVGERLRRSGYKMRPGSHKPRTSTSELARLYFDEGLSLVQVGTRVGLTRKGVSTRLRSAGYRLRAGTHPRLALDPKQLARLYFDEGLTLAQVAARVGATAQTVRLHLAEAGYPTASAQPVM
jgi:DNA-binding transcriptional regulator LsrR (DeoR family)